LLNENAGKTNGIKVGLLREGEAILNHDGVDHLKGPFVSSESSEDYMEMSWK
jgi:hypothetical protein